MDCFVAPLLAMTSGKRTALQITCKSPSATSIPPRSTAAGGAGARAGPAPPGTHPPPGGGGGGRGRVLGRHPPQPILGQRMVRQNGQALVHFLSGDAKQ